MCGCSGSGSSVNVPVGRLSQLPNTPMKAKTENCELTQEIITNWKTLLECVVSKELLHAINLSKLQANQYLGLLQSALNYPDDYCYYDIQLNLFKEAILPRILENVPECNE